ncbi:hypothetical protein BDZ45DRAFT_690237 [Acephala macrosclerotiorum]|nr:hypothetical protein BDZ45DRAFT_690237 [Acephala macrosclerotiorum]
MTKAKVEKHDTSTSENGDLHDDPNAEQAYDDYEILDKNTIHLQRRNRYISNESYRFFLFHAILDQVLSVEAYKKINWVEIAKATGTGGPKSSHAANNDFNATWKSLHSGRRFLQDKEAKLEQNLTFSRCDIQHVHLLLAIIDELVGHAQKPKAGLTELAVKLGRSSEAQPRQMFVRLWEKYLRIQYPDLCPEKKNSRAKKMDEWIVHMHSFDNGDDDEEPPPPYEKHDSNTSKTGQQNAGVDSEIIDLLPNVEDMDLTAEGSATRRKIVELTFRGRVESCNPSNNARHEVET